MLKKIKAALKERKYITVKYGDEMAVHYPKKRFSPKNGIHRKFYLGDEFCSNNTDSKIGLMPYLDNELPDLIIIDEKTNQLTEMIYVVDGLGYIGRIDCEKPAKIVIKDGKIIKEQYARFVRKRGEKNHYSIKSRIAKFGVTQYTIPDTVIYEEDGSINEIESFWRFEVEKGNQLYELDTELLSFEKYRKILRIINIDPLNYKKWTQTERILVSIYMDVEVYKDIFDKFDIECSIESFEKNKELFEMYYT